MMEPRRVRPQTFAPLDSEGGNLVGMRDLGPEGARLVLRDEPDGILYMALHGELSDEMARAMVGAFRRMADSGREVLVLSDMHHAGPLPPGPRKTTAEEMRTARLDAVAIIGAAFSVRVIATFAAKGVQLLTSRSYPVEFFDTEREARAWLLARRDALRARRRPLT